MIQLAFPEVRSCACGAIAPDHYSTILEGYVQPLGWASDAQSGEYLCGVRDESGARICFWNAQQKRRAA